MIDELADLRKLELPFDVDEVDPQCHECIRAQLIKYEKHQSADGKSCKGRFLVDCSGIPKDTIDPTVKMGLSAEQIDNIEAVKDITKFSKKYLKLPDGSSWEARPYQAAVLKCSSRRKVLRIGRRSGKTDSVCVEICYYLYTKKRSRILVVGPQKVHVQEIFSRVRAFIAASPLLRDSIVHDISAPYYQLELANGSELRGFAAGTKGNTEGTSIRGQNADRIYCFPKGTLVNTSEFAIKPIEKLTLEDSVLGGDESGVRIGDVKSLFVHKDRLITIPTALNVVKCTYDHPLFNGTDDIPAKEATEVIASLYHQDLTFGYENVLCRLLGSLYGDGWISNEAVGFSGQELDLEQIKADLRVLGDRDHVVTGRQTTNENLGISGWGAQLNSTYTYPFFKDLHPTGEKVFQQLRVPKMIMEGKSYFKSSFLSGLFSAESTGVTYQTNKRTPRPISLTMFSTKEDWINTWFSDIGKLLSDLEIRYTYKVNYLEEKNRYVGLIAVCNQKENIDLFIERIGFCHNAEKTVQANTYKLFRHYEKTWNKESWKKNRRIRSQSCSSLDASKKLNLSLSTVKYHKALYDELYSNPLLTPEEYINKIRWQGNYVKLPILKENVRYSDELVDVYNLTSGANNRFFAGGYFTHNCEECDYVDENALQGAVLPILHTTPTTTLVAFSTPSGFKSVYYSMCCDSPSYKEYYYTYKVLPHWKTVEAEKSSFTEEQWNREYLANFGDTESGVYKPTYVDRALTNYEYSNITNHPAWKYTIGTDWNEKHGTEICVLGYNTHTHMFQVAETLLIEKSEFTQLSGVSKLLEMNKKWKPSFIYIDSGNGSTNYELLRKTAYENSTRDGDRDTARLLQILKRYDSGASIEIRDPVSQQKVKVPAKPFMVNASVRLFEQNKIRISSFDNVLEKQLRSYIIERLTPTKTPVYGLSEPKVLDHRLDALNLAIVAFQLEFSDLHTQNVCMETASVADPRTVKSSENSRNKTEDERYSRPEERRMESAEMTWVEQQLFSNRVKSDLSHIPSNKPGWSEDKEGQRRSEWLHRRRSRGNVERNRPNRSNI
jgi:hypothetical protein